MGSAHLYPFLAIWKLHLYFRAANSKDKTLNINFRGRPVTFFLLIDLYSARYFFLLVQSNKVKNLKYSLPLNYVVHIPLNYTKNRTYARVLVLIPWDTCGTPTVKIRFGCTKIAKPANRIA